MTYDCRFLYQQQVMRWWCTVCGQSDQRCTDQCKVRFGLKAKWCDGETPGRWTPINWNELSERVFPFPIVWVFRRLKKLSRREMGDRGYALHSACAQLSFPFPFLLPADLWRPIRYLKWSAFDNSNFIDNYCLLRKYVVILERYSLCKMHWNPKKLKWKNKINSFLGGMMPKCRPLFNFGKRSVLLLFWKNFSK